MLVCLLICTKNQALSKEFKDAFTWIYAEMPRLDPQLVKHRLKVKEEIGLVKLDSKNVKPELEYRSNKRFRNC